jgi:DNA-directed RNA polymerase specialized sigma subunit
MKKDNWRLIPVTAQQLDVLAQHSPEDIIISILDHEQKEVDFPFNFFELINETKLLTPKQKQVIEMRIVYELTFDEIGQELETTRQNVFEIFHKGIANLKKDLSWYKPELKGE